MVQCMYGNIQGIKNLMSHYDKDGDYINPVNGLAGLLVTDENESSRKRIISIPDSSKEEMYELAKKEFLNENGTLMVILPKGRVYITIYTEKWIRMTAYQQAGQWNNMNINTDRHLQKLQKPQILHGELVNQYRLAHWMALRESRWKVAGSQ